MKVLVTGGAGFIGSHFVERLLRSYADVQVVVLDALTYAGTVSNLAAVWDHPQFFFWQGNITDPVTVGRLIEQVDAVVHFAAETHVDHSIHNYNTDDFIDTDVKGTQVLLDAVRHHPVARFVHISTSEVYGAAQSELMAEHHPLNPRSPYASAKCGADRLVYAYTCTFAVPAVIVRPFNNYGPRQHNEKLIPRIITSVLQGQSFPLHGDGASARDWVFVADNCAAIDLLLHAPLEQVQGEVFNVATGVETDIYTIAQLLLEYLGEDESLIQWCAQRPGQVSRHRGDSTKLQQLLGWEAQVSLAEGLERTVKWYRANEPWWRQLRRKELAVPQLSAATGAEPAPRGLLEREKLGAIHL